MRSLIILEVEHDDDTTELTNLVESFKPSAFHDTYRISVLNSTVRVDLPECFQLED